MGCDYRITLETEAEEWIVMARTILDNSTLACKFCNNEPSFDTYRNSEPSIEAIIARKTNRLNEQVAKIAEGVIKAVVYLFPDENEVDARARAEILPLFALKAVPTDENVGRCLENLAKKKKHLCNTLSRMREDNGRQKGKIIMTDEIMTDESISLIVEKHLGAWETERYAGIKVGGLGLDRYLVDLKAAIASDLEKLSDFHSIANNILDIQAIKAEANAEDEKNEEGWPLQWSNLDPIGATTDFILSTQIEMEPTASIPGWIARLRNQNTYFSVNESCLVSAPTLEDSPHPTPETSTAAALFSTSMSARHADKGADATKAMTLYACGRTVPVWSLRVSRAKYKVTNIIQDLGMPHTTTETRPVFVPTPASLVITHFDAVGARKPDVTSPLLEAQTASMSLRLSSEEGKKNSVPTLNEKGGSNVKHFQVGVTSRLRGTDITIDTIPPLMTQIMSRTKLEGTTSPPFALRPGTNKRFGLLNTLAFFALAFSGSTGPFTKVTAASPDQFIEGGDNSRQDSKGGVKILADILEGQGQKGNTDLLDGQQGAVQLNGEATETGHTSLMEDDKNLESIAPHLRHSSSDFEWHSSLKEVSSIIAEALSGNAWNNDEHMQDGDDAGVMQMIKSAVAFEDGKVLSGRSTIDEVVQIESRQDKVKLSRGHTQKGRYTEQRAARDRSHNRYFESSQVFGGAFAGGLFNQFSKTNPRQRKSKLHKNSSRSKFSKLGSLFQNDIVVKEKHAARLELMTDVCLPTCEPTDWSCTCTNLFTCAKQTTTLDIMTLISGGFIDTNPDSDTHGNFTVDVEELQLYNADVDLNVKLDRIKDLAEGDITQETCAAVLEEFFSACDPSKVSCTNPNIESFQLSAEQVCDSVNTPIKLLFSAIGDEFDNFVHADNSVNYHIVCGQSGQCDEEDTLDSSEEKHAVRCCSDSDLGGGWTSYCNNVWAESNLGEDNSECFQAEIHADAERICKASGGRLCTKEEMEADCTSGTGCEYNYELVWTSTPEAKSHEFFSFQACHEFVTTFDRLYEAASAYYVACGKPASCSGTEGAEGAEGAADISDLYAVRCCSDEEISGWIQNCDTVWAQSDFDDSDDELCYDDQNFTSARAICSDNGGRLCTQEELHVGCAIDTGCSFNNRLVWSSTLERSYYVACGNPDNDSCTEIGGADMNDLHAVRCCSDEEITGWEQTCGVVWAQSDFDDSADELCYDNQSFTEANNICTGYGGRLCTKDELNAKCASGTGCSFDKELVWSSTLASAPANPMRKDPSTTLHDKDINEIFQYTNFPLGYFFSQDAETGVIRRKFDEEGSSWFSIVNPLTGTALTLADSNCDLTVVEALTHDSSNKYQHFRLSGKMLEPRMCRNTYVTVGDKDLTDSDSLLCEVNNRLVLQEAYSYNSMYENYRRQDFSISCDEVHTLTSDRCPGMAVSVIKDNTIHEINDPEEVVIHIVNEVSGLAMSVNASDESCSKRSIDYKEIEGYRIVGEGTCRDSSGSAQYARYWYYAPDELETEDDAEVIAFFQEICTQDDRCAAVYIYLSWPMAMVFSDGDECEHDCDISDWSDDPSLIVDSSGATGWTCYAKEEHLGCSDENGDSNYAHYVEYAEDEADIKALCDEDERCVGYSFGEIWDYDVDSYTLVADDGRCADDAGQFASHARYHYYAQQDLTKANTIETDSYYYKASFTINENDFHEAVQQRCNADDKCVAYAVVLSLGKAWIYSDNDDACVPEPADVDECMMAPKSGAENVLAEVGDSLITPKIFSASGLTTDHRCPWYVRTEVNSERFRFQVDRCGNELTLTRRYCSDGCSDHTDGWDIDLKFTCYENQIQYGHDCGESEWIDDPSLITRGSGEEDDSNVFYHVVCGKSGECDEDNGLASPDEKHAVRCCSDTDPGGEWSNSNCDDVWAESDLGEDNSECFTATNPQSHADAERICEEAHGRLCTKEELEANCAGDTGCGGDSELVWTSTSETRFYNCYVKKTKKSGGIIYSDGSKCTHNCDRSEWIDDPSLVHASGTEDLNCKVKTVEGDLDEILAEPLDLEDEAQKFTLQKDSGSYHIRSVKCPELGIGMYLSDMNGCNSGYAELVSLDVSDTSFHLWMDTGKFTVGSSGIIGRVDCEDYALALSNDVFDADGGTQIMSQYKDETHLSQLWTLTTTDVSLRLATGVETQDWRAEFVDPPYNFAFLPGFPGDLETDEDGNRFLSSTTNKELAKTVVDYCDESMAVLLGSQMSTGTLQAIVDVIEKDGTDRMPGTCCFDTPTSNWDYLGVEYDPSTMECEEPGLWHFGISDEACANAGGKWTRTPCVTLQSCIDDRPRRFDLDNPSDCSDHLGEDINFGYVSISTDHDNFTVPSHAEGEDNEVELSCFEFCRSLHGYTAQIGMMVEHGTDSDVCVCMYDRDNVPNSDLLPDFVMRPLPNFYLTNPNDGSVLGLAPHSDCSSDDLIIEAQRQHETLRQEFTLTQDGRIASAICPHQVLTGPTSSQCIESVRLHLLAPYIDDADEQQWSYSDAERTFRNLACPELYISSMKDDATLQSYFAAIVNPRTNLAMDGGDDCIDGTGITLEELAEGSAQQNFRVHCNRLLSLTCPDLAVAIAGNNCTDGATIELQSRELDSLNNWQMNDDGTIESISCPGMIVGIEDTSSSAVSSKVNRVQSKAKNRFISDSFPDETVFDNSTSYESTGYASGKEWVQRSMPSAGSRLVLSSPRDQHKYQQWTTKHQQFTGLMGPYFIINPHNGYALGVAKSKCTDEMELQTQAYDPSSTLQQFYRGKSGAIFSSSCKGLVISIGTHEGDCGNDQEGELVRLQTYTTGALRMKWKFNNNGSIESARCEGYVIGMSGGSDSDVGGGIELRTYDEADSSQTWRRENTRLLDPSSVRSSVVVDADWANPSENAMDHEEGTYFTFDVEEWEQSIGNAVLQETVYNHVDLWRDGSEIWSGSVKVWPADDDHPCAYGRVQLEDPYYYVACGAPTGDCSGNEGAADINDLHDVRCCSDEEISGWSQTCGAVWAQSKFDGVCYGNKTFTEAEAICSDNGGRLCTKEELYDACASGTGCQFNYQLVWSSTQATHLSSHFQTGDQLSLQHPYVDATAWNHEWVVVFSDPEHDSGTFNERIQAGSSGAGVDSTCYPLNGAFSAAFEDFAQDIEIGDAAEEDQCRKARERLGFEPDYEFDTNVCQEYNDYICDPHFTGIDVLTEPIKEAPTFTHVEYEPVEYTEVDYTEEEYEAPEYKDDPDLPGADLPTHSDVMKADDYEDQSHSGLLDMQSQMLMADRAIMALELLYDLAYQTFDSCELLVDFFDVLEATCKGYIMVVIFSLLSALILARNKAANLSQAYVKATLGPDVEIYTASMTEATYHNIINLDKYISGALPTIDQTIKDQHRDMRAHLQARHLAMETNLGEDLVEVQNALGQSIVDAQNALGQGIVDAQNAVGQDVVDAQNANSDQHNAIGAWLHESLCLIYETLDGTCETFIGPLKENQLYTPMILEWPEGQQNGMEKLQQVANKGLSIEAKIEAIEEKMSFIEEKMSFIEEKMSSNMNEIKDVNAKMDELKQMMSQLILQNNVQE